MHFSWQRLKLSAAAVGSQRLCAAPAKKRASPGLCREAPFSIGFSWQGTDTVRPPSVNLRVRLARVGVELPPAGLCVAGAAALLFWRSPRSVLPPAKLPVTGTTGLLGLGRLLRPGCAGTVVRDRSAVLGVVGCAADRPYLSAGRGCRTSVAMPGSIAGGAFAGATAGGKTGDRNQVDGCAARAQAAHPQLRLRPAYPNPTCQAAANS
jgi:hypothetical protein